MTGLKTGLDVYEEKKERLTEVTFRDFQGFVCPDKVRIRPKQRKRTLRRGVGNRGPSKGGEGVLDGVTSEASTKQSKCPTPHERTRGAEGHRGVGRVPVRDPPGSHL